MSKTAFAKRIISALNDSIGRDGTVYDESSPAKANEAIAKAVTDYLIENTEVTSAYSGMIGTSADPVVQDKHRLKGDCTPVGTKDNLGDWLNELCDNIKSSFMVDDGEKGVKFECYPIFQGSASLPDLSAIPHSGSEDPQLDCWELICDSIISWVNSQPPTSPTSASRPSAGSSGTGFSAAILLL